jgi:hypothetical protein
MIPEDGVGEVMNENVLTLHSYMANIKAESTQLILLYIFRLRTPA